MTTGHTVGDALQNDLLAQFARAYRKHEEENENRPTAITAEDRIGAWLGHDREFREAVALVRTYLRDRCYKLGGSSKAQ